MLGLRILLPNLEGLRAIAQHLLLAARYLVAQDVHLVLQVWLEDLLRLLEVLLLLASRVDGAALDEVVGVQGPRDQILPRLRIVDVGRCTLGRNLALKQSSARLGARGSSGSCVAKERATEWDSADVRIVERPLYSVVFLYQASELALLHRYAS